MHAGSDGGTCRYVKVLGGAEEVARLPPGPAVVVSPLPSLAAGPSRRLLAAWGADARNAIVLPGRPPVGFPLAHVIRLKMPRGQSLGRWCLAGSPHKACGTHICSLHCGETCNLLSKSKSPPL